MDLSSYDLDYLRPPFEASFINHNLDYIKSGSGAKAKRRIFYNVSFEAEEIKAIEQLENLLKSQGVTLPQEWNQSETLKFLYAQKFNLHTASEMIQTCLEWREDPSTSTIEGAVLQYLEAGVIYTFGLDHQFRPVLIINLNKLRNLQIDEDTFKIALVITMDVIRTYCFLPRKIENCLVVIDAQGVKTIDAENIKAISYLLKCCFPSTFERLILITSPNFKDSHSSLIHSVATKEELEDVKIVSSTDLKALQTYIPAEHLEKKYGGEFPTVEKFWPPPKRNEVYHRTSVTSLKQYSEANSIASVPNENLSARSRSRQGPMEMSDLKPYTFDENRSQQQSLVSETYRLQPNQLGALAQSQNFAKKKGPLFHKMDDNVGRSTAPIQPTSNQGSPSKKYRANDPFAKARNDSAEHTVRTDFSASNNRNTVSAERFMVTEAEAPKMTKKSNYHDLKMEPTSLHKGLSSQSSEVFSRAESPVQGKRKVLTPNNVTPTHRRESSQPENKPSEMGNRVSYAIYGSNSKSGQGYNETNNGYGKSQQGNGRTFEEDEADSPNMSLSQIEKEKMKKRLVEISSKQAEESDEEDAKNKKGLFCGCCVNSKKKEPLLRSRSKMKKSKYDY